MTSFVESFETPMETTVSVEFLCGGGGAEGQNFITGFWKLCFKTCVPQKYRRCGSVVCSNVHLNESAKRLKNCTCNIVWKYFQKFVLVCYGEIAFESSNILARKTLVVGGWFEWPFFAMHQHLRRCIKKYYILVSSSLSLPKYRNKLNPGTKI